MLYYLYTKIILPYKYCIKHRFKKLLKIFLISSIFHSMINILINIMVIYFYYKSIFKKLLKNVKLSNLSNRTLFFLRIS